MDTKKIERDLAIYDRKIIDKRLELERIIIKNRQIEQLRQKEADLIDLISSVSTYRDNLHTLNAIVQKEDNAFKERRIGYLNDEITENLLRIFPSKGFTARIDCDLKRGTGKASLKLIDKEGRVHIPYISEGKLCQYLISFAATIGAIKGLETNTIYIDEAFGVASADNLPKIGKILQDAISKDLQIILISQNASLYEEIPHRVLSLVEDPTDSSVILKDVKDY